MIIIVTYSLWEVYFASRFHRHIPAPVHQCRHVPTCSDLDRSSLRVAKHTKAVGASKAEGPGTRRPSRIIVWKFLTKWYIAMPDCIIYIYILCIYYRRKFRSQTSDNMERWKAEQGRGTEKRKIRREKIRRERVRGQKIQMREKVGKSRNTVFFQWFVAQEGRKVGSLKRRVRSQLATGAMKNCTPLWREAHFQVKMYKTPGVRTTFGSWDVEKVHAVVARSTFPSQNVQNTSASDHF